MHICGVLSVYASQNTWQGVFMIILIGLLSGAVTRSGSQAVSVIDNTVYRFKGTINHISAGIC